MTYAAYMLKITSLKELFTITNFDKIASSVADPTECLLFVSKIVLFFGF